MSILFIDDDPDDTELFCEVVAYLNNSEFLADKEKKIQCHALNQAARSIDFISKLPELPDYIFMDINMPGIGGEECLLDLKRHPKFRHIPIVMLSTVCGDEDKNKFIKLGADDCIEKPTQFNALARVFSGYIYQKYL